MTVKSQGKQRNKKGRGGSNDSAEVIIIYGSAKKRRFKIFHKRKTGKNNMEGGVRRELIKWKD
jgi:hypothetical protein